jgi:hypothetical protein
MLNQNLQVIVMCMAYDYYSKSYFFIVNPTVAEHKNVNCGIFMKKCKCLYSI